MYFSPLLGYICCNEKLLAGGEVIIHDDNPYASPAIISEITEEPPRLVFDKAYVPPASSGKRLSNSILDGIDIQILAYGIGIVWGTAFVAFRVDPTVPLAQHEITAFKIGGYIIGFGLTVMYYILSEGLCGRSPAKFLTGTCVVRADGNKPSWGQIIGRSLARMIPFDAFSYLGGGMVGPVGWHDSLSGTRVVSVSKVN